MGLIYLIHKQLICFFLLVQIIPNRLLNNSLIQKNSVKFLLCASLGHGEVNKLPSCFQVWYSVEGKRDEQTHKC